CGRSQISRSKRIKIWCRIQDIDYINQNARRCERRNGEFYHLNENSMNSYLRKISYIRPIAALFWGITQTQAQVTTVKIDVSAKEVQIDPMIYGQMLENVNDSMIYGGVVDLKGNVRQHLIPP